MSATMNLVIVAGNLTRDPQVKFLANDKSVASFGLAINNRFKSADGTMKEDTVFVDVEAWGRTAELAGQYLTKGSACLIEGRLKLDTWEKDGQKQSKIKVVANNIQFMDKKDGHEKKSSAPKTARENIGSSASTPVAPFNDEPPFAPVMFP